LKVKPPDEFDMVIPVDIGEGSWEVVDGRNATVGGVDLESPGFCLVRKVRKGRKIVERVHHSREKRREIDRNERKMAALEDYVTKINNRDYFAPEKLMRELQKIIHKAMRGLNKITNKDLKEKVHKVTGGVDGPSMKLTVLYRPGKGGKVFKEFDLDFVLELRVGGKHLVAKRHPLVTQDDILGDDPIALLWQESWSEQESLKIREISDEKDGTCRKKCWKLVKALCLSNRHLKCLCSYFYKTLFLNFLEEKPDFRDWSGENLIYRFLETFSYLEKVLHDKFLPLYCTRNHGDVNMLLPRYDEIMVENVYYYVRKINMEKSHVQLIHTSQSEIRKTEQKKRKVRIPRRDTSKSTSGAGYEECSVYADIMTGKRGHRQGIDELTELYRFKVMKL
jgi:hypothetical protein